MSEARQRIEWLFPGIGLVGLDFPRRLMESLGALFIRMFGANLNARFRFIPPWGRIWDSTESTIVCLLALMAIAAGAADGEVS